jgi:hypothetical protein
MKTIPSAREKKHKIVAQVIDAEHGDLILLFNLKGSSSTGKVNNTGDKKSRGLAVGTPPMSETFSMVKEQVEKKCYLKHLGGGGVLTGGGALMPGAADLAREVFGVPARIGFPKEVGGLVAEYKNPAYAAAVGLVMYAAEMSDIESFDRHTKRKKTTGLLGRLRDVFGEFF